MFYVKKRNFMLNWNWVLASQLRFDYAGCRALLLASAEFFRDKEIEMTTKSLEDKALANKVILVTGASQGLGAEVAKACAAAGATVVLLGAQSKEIGKGV